MVRDIGLKLNVPAVMNSLVRTRVGNFTVDNSFTLEEISNNSFSLINIIDAFPNIPTIKVDEKMANKIKNGVILDRFFDDEFAFIIDENENLIEIQKEEENKKIKLIKFRENQMTYIENIKKLKILKKKKTEIINICKFCTGFDNFNINDIEDIPCINIQCKIFYEKLKIENEIDEYININKNIENLEYDIPEEFEQ